MKVKINNRYYNHFDEIIINRTVTNVASTFSLKGKFDPNNKFHREVFKPLSYNTIQIYNDNNKLLFTGFCVNSSFNSSSKDEPKKISGYSKAGILDNVNISPDNYPLEFNNLTLREIATKVLKPFGLKFSVRDYIYDLDSTPSRSVLLDRFMDITYESVDVDPEEYISAFLSRLSNERNIILTHNQFGDLVFYKKKNRKPRYTFDKNNSLKMGLRVNGQNIHSEINVLRQPGSQNIIVSSQDKIKTNVININKPRVKILHHGQDNDTENAVSGLLSREYSNIIFNIDLEKEIFLNPGDDVEVYNPEIYLFKKTRLTISEIQYTQVASSVRTTLQLVIPESFSGEVINGNLF